MYNKVAFYEDEKRFLFLHAMSRCKFYIAVTRARYSVGIVFNDDELSFMEGIKKYKT